MRVIIAEAWADVKQRRWQSLAALVTIAAAAAMLYVGLVAMTSFGSAYNQMMKRTNGAHVFTLTPANADGSAVVDDLRNKPGVAASEARPARIIQVALDSGKADVRAVMTAVQPGRQALMGWSILEGRDLQPGDVDRALMSISLARYYGIHAGYRLVIDSPSGPRDVEIVGLEADPMWQLYPMITLQNLFVLPETLDRFADSGTPVTVLGLRLADPSTADRFVYDTTLMPGGEHIALRMSWIWTSTFLAMFQAFTSVFMLTFALLAVLAAAMITSNIVAGAVLGRMREIGVLKAVGWTREQILLLFGGQNLAIGGIGTLVGLVAGHAAVSRTLGALAENTGNPGVTAFHPVLAIAVLTVMAILIAGAAVAAAWRAANNRPAEALRGSPVAEDARLRPLIALLQRIRLPEPVLLGIKDATSRRGRMIITVTSVTLAVLAAPMVVSPNSFIARLEKDPGAIGVPYQLVVVPKLISAAEAEQIVASAPGFETYYAECESRAALPDFDRQIPVTAAAPGWESMPFRIIDGRRIENPGELMLPPTIIKALGLKLGDRVALQIGTTTADFTLVGKYVNPIEMGSVAFVRLEDFRQLVPTAAVNVLRVRLHEGADAEVAAASIRAAACPGATEVVTFAQQLIPPMMKDMARRSGLMLLALVVIAALSVLNTTLLSLREQMREAAVRKAVGMTPWQIILASATGGSWLGLCGAAIGVPLGIVLNGVVIAALTSQLGIGALNLSLPLAVDGLFLTGGIALAAVAALPAAVLAARTAPARILATE